MDRFHSDITPTEPLQTLANPLPFASSSALPQSGSSHPPQTILLADDEENLLFSYSLGLQLLGFKTISANNGMEAVEIFESRRGEIDAVILDITMPLMSGLEALATIRMIDPHKPVIIVSGHGEALGMAETARDLGAVFLAKPFSASELAESLRSIYPAKTRIHETIQS